MSADAKSKLPPEPQPLIPEAYIDVPSQRLYYLSFGLVCQAIKLFDFFQYLFAPDDITTHYGKKWLFVDFAYCTILSQLRIPRLKYSKAVVFLQIATLWFLDGVLFGGISLHVGGGSAGEHSSLGWSSGRFELPSTPEPFRLADLLSPLAIFSSSSSSSSTKDPHLLGQHTVRMSPISTANLNPNTLTFCLAPPSSNVLVPILLNNTNVASIRYSLTPLGYIEGDSRTGRVEYVDLSAKELKAIEQARVEHLQLIKPSVSKKYEDEYDEYDDDDEDSSSSSSQSPGSALQRTQSLAHIKVTKAGMLRLERILDTSGNAARIAYPHSLTIVPCPSAQFAEDKRTPDVMCEGQELDVELGIEISGVPPLSLRWHKDVNGRRESYLVEGIEGGHEHAHQGEQDRRPQGIFEELRVPLAVTLDALGKHSYVLEEIIDGVGNTIRVADGPSSMVMRTISVLRHPTMSFKHCGPGMPASLLIGSEATLTVSTNEADSLDAPWEVALRYQPPIDADGKSSKRYKPWKKTLKTRGENRELNFNATAPGDYTITSVKGKYCEGDVLAPETCKVVEKPLPTAEIEWRKIHECSGDTGVSASLVLHGTPPFYVYYRTQRDKEAPRELSKMFTTSRGELTLQPERSGHYIYSFSHISDVFYKKIELDGPTVDQIVHPLATAEFAAGTGAKSGAGAGRKKRINSCAGDVVDVEVNLRGQGPWNLEVQVVGPQSSETLVIPDIIASQKTLQIPIPKIVDRDGGSFDIDLVSIEDSYGCKRPLSVPGISVNVRRVKPTAKFYGKDRKRHVTVLEHETANLPLRLTGDGPWYVKYRRTEIPDQIHTANLTTPNDQLKVVEKGVYELLDVVDSQCPGSIIANEATYEVSWVPRPFATLSPQTVAYYESYNGSHILPPICEGLGDHVDLELTGRPPFQIMYNIAQDSETGGTKLLDQPTFSSIQPHTRFQLHTSASGRKYYEVKQIGDAAYPLTKHKNAVIPRSQRLLFEQEVLGRPSAQFRNRNRIFYCLYDEFVARDTSGADGAIVLEGTPPFELELSIKNLAASEVQLKTVQVNERTWKLDLPGYNFMSMGPHLVSIESVQDASHCEQAALDPLYRSIWIDVAETAAIVPFDRRRDYCVGDVSQFQLEGTPPWTIGYNINGKSYTQEAKVSPFSLIQQQPGEFTIVTIAHQQKMCRAAVTDLRFTVHPLPSAQVGHGKRIFQDIHEGDQAEIVFTLVGEPPFTFTYQRSEPSPKKGGRAGKVLETHTVSGVTTKEYSIYSALEGTWTVTSISDKYCRYPPAQPDGISEKGR